MILVAGIGNIFLGDDGFGPEVICRLLRRPPDNNVRIVDYGIRGLDLAYALLDPLDAVFIVDATQRGGSPGTLYVIAPELPDAKDAAQHSFNAHALNPVSVLQLASMMGAN